MEITEQTVLDIKKLLEDGVDDFWWTCEYDGNWSLINRLRALFELPIIEEAHLKTMQKYWKEL